jgi:hypothetical protein
MGWTGCQPFSELNKRPHKFVLSSLKDSIESKTHRQLPAGTSWPWFVAAMPESPEGVEIESSQKFKGMKDKPNFVLALNVRIQCTSLAPVWAALFLNVHKSPT